MSGNPIKLLFAISDTGGGHRSAAKAIVAALNQESDTSCVITDFLRVTNVPGLKHAPEIYDYCSKHHLWLNNLFFQKTNSISRIAELTKLVYSRSQRYIESELSTIQPSMVVSVHPLVTGLLCKARDKFRATWPIITVVTDLVTIHASWATPGADLYLAPTPEAVQALKNHGIPGDKITLTGFPVNPKFTDCRLSQQQARQELGITPDCFTVLLTGGGVGAGNMLDWMNTLETECPYCQILVVTGNNKDLYSELSERSLLSSRMKVFGFVNNMETMMCASDIVITKAGPGTIMETVAMRRPLIVTEAVGIQEMGNIDYIRQNGLGFHCPTPAEACRRVEEVYRKQAIAVGLFNSESVAKDGATQIADIILRQLAKLPLPRFDISAKSLGA